MPNGTPVNRASMFADTVREQSCKDRREGLEKLFDEKTNNLHHRLNDLGTRLKGMGLKQTFMLVLVGLELLAMVFALFKLP